MIKSQIDPKTELMESLKLPATDAEQILSAFSSVVEVVASLEPELPKIVNSKKITKDLCAKAKTLRLKYQKARTEGDRIHKKIKAEVLLRSKAIDGARNIFKLQISEKENLLKQVEDYFENLEIERKNKLAEKRSKMLAKFRDDVENLNLGEMEPEVWEAFYKSEKEKHEAYQEALRQAEIERVLQEKKQKLINERTDILINCGLYQFFDYSKIDSLGEMPEKEFKALASELDKLKKDNEEKEKQIQEENEKLKKQLEEKEKMEKELQEKKAEEARQKQEELEKQREAERAAKNQKYLDFLAKHGAKLEDIKPNGKYLVRQEGEEFILYKKIAKIKI